MTRLRMSLFAIATLAGCAAPKPAVPAATVAAVDGLPPADVVTIAAPSPTASIAEAVAPRDAEPARAKFFQISFYELTVGQGEISGKDAFWKPFDESFLGLWRHDVLHKNGLRVGRAPLVELAYLKERMEGAEESKQDLIGTESKDFEMTVRKDVPQQTIFYAGEDGQFTGHDFVAIDNLFAITFRRAPRKQDRVRIKLTPMVRDQRARLEVRDLRSMKVDLSRRQSFYELGVDTDLGLDECLVIAPASSALSNQTSVGRIFMMEDRPAERVEKILVIVPRLQGTLVETTPGMVKR